MMLCVRNSDQNVTHVDLDLFPFLRKGTDDGT